MGANPTEGGERKKNHPDLNLMRGSRHEKDNRIRVKAVARGCCSVFLGSPLRLLVRSGLNLGTRLSSYR